MNLTDDQKRTVAAWINEGLKLSEIQKRLETQFALRLTYMEVRFLIDDLKLMPKDVEPPKPPVPVVPPPAAAVPAPKAPASPAPIPTPAAAPVGGQVSVELDKITRPGALVSGKVVFSDGQSAGWYLDEMGRLGLIPAQQGYKPSAPDVQSFQRALQTELQKLGY